MMVEYWWESPLYLQAFRVDIVCAVHLHGLDSSTTLEVAFVLSTVLQFVRK